MTQRRVANFCNAVLNDPSRQFETILFVLEEDMVGPIDFETHEPPIPERDREVQMQMDEAQVGFDIKTEDHGRVNTEQEFHPGHFELRLLGNEEEKQIAQEEEVKCDLATAFKGGADHSKVGQSTRCRPKSMENSDTGSGVLTSNLSCLFTCDFLWATAPLPSASLPVLISP